MTQRSRLLLSLASLLLLGAYVFPIWRIDLDAPQYPEGLGMKIEIDDITGKKPNDLDNINNLNHYIGMKRIEPDAIPALRLMPWVVGGLVLLGLGAAASGRKGMLYAWVGLFAVAAVAGLVDFYLWSYDYGHNLDHEHAIIKIPGMTYQPPLIGSKQLLNFTAHSWPALGGWLAFLSGGLGVLAIVLERVRARPAALAGVLAFVLLAAGCTPAPQPIRYGHDSCAHCRMTVSDERYGAELVTRKGKAHVFDSIECMAAYLDEGRIAEAEIALRLVADFHAPGTLRSVDEAFFLHSPNLQSPMGAGLTAFGPGIAPQSAIDAFSGEVLDWPGVRALLRGAHPAAHAAH